MKKYLYKIIILFLLNIFAFFNVYADDEYFEFTDSSEQIIETIDASSNINDLSDINSRHAIILDRESFQTLYGKKENETCKMASTTKIMTAMVVIENANLNDIVTVSKKAAGTGGSRLGLSTNDKITVENLLYGLLLKSGNDTAVALAEYVGGDIENFANMMNTKAQELGLSSTNFVTPHGLDNDEHFTTAYDLAVLSDYALKNETFARIVNTKSYTVMINNRPKTLNNTNELLGNYDGIYGVKTGFTNGANRCLVTSCKRGDLDVICVVLGCDTKKDRTRDSVKLLNYVFNNFTTLDVEGLLKEKFEEWKNEHKNSFVINKGISQNLDLYIDSASIKFSKMGIKKSDLNTVYADISFDSYLEAPVYENIEIGTITLKDNNKEYFSVSILNNNIIYKKNVFNYLLYFVKNYSSFFAIS